jgi:hypothetical protein
MSRLLLAVAVAAILFLVGAFVPIDGKTLVERWNGKSAAKVSQRPATKGASPARQGPGSSAAGQKRAPQPVEHHTEEDRSAIDRIVAEHASDRPASGR